MRPGLVCRCCSARIFHAVDPSLHFVPASCLKRRERAASCVRLNRVPWCREQAARGRRWRLLTGAAEWGSGDGFAASAVAVTLPVSKGMFQELLCLRSYVLESGAVYNDAVRAIADARGLCPLTAAVRSATRCMLPTPSRAPGCPKTGCISTRAVRPQCRAQSSTAGWHLRREGEPGSGGSCPPLVGAPPGSEREGCYEISESSICCSWSTTFDGAPAGHVRVFNTNAASTPSARDHT